MSHKQAKKFRKKIREEFPNLSKEEQKHLIKLGKKLLGEDYGTATQKLKQHSDGALQPTNADTESSIFKQG